MVRLDRAHRRPLIVLGCLLLASVGAAYLWAVIFGDGLRGPKTAQALDQANSYPDADLALLASLGGYLFSCLIGIAATRPARRRPPALLIGRWLIPTAISGLVLFAASRVVI